MKSKIAFPLITLVLLIAISTVTALAREGAPPKSSSQPVRPLPTVQQLVVTPTEPQAELAFDATRPPAPVRFAAQTEVIVTPSTHGTWEAVAGGQLWRFRVISAGATDLNFGFTTYRLPEGATLHLYSEGEDYVQGPYDSRDNKAHGQLWTPVLPGSRAVIELFVPGDATEQPQLVLSWVNRGYRDMFGRQKAGAKSHGACNIDVICPLGDAWREEIRSVARYSRSGSFLCTGTLMNTANNSTNNQYFLTAHHCGVTAGTAPTVVAYWNYQAPVCGQRSGGSLSQSQSGSFFRASRADVDMTLIELDEVPNPAHRVTYSGWDRSGVAPGGAVGIHHPQGDVKSICASSNTLTTTNSCISGGGINSHWQVVWSQGTTEQGSSGSAIFNPSNHRVVGFLSGGDASCANLLGPDCYGKFSVAWDGGSSATRLRDWLDPLNSGVTGVSGRDPFAIPFIANAGSALVSESCLPTNSTADPGEMVTFNFSLQNIYGTNTGTVIATLLATNGVTSPSGPQNYGILNTNGTVVTRPFSFVASNSCGAFVAATLRIQDGTITTNIPFLIRMGAPSVLTQNFDSEVPPALPAGWSNSVTGGSVGWRTTNNNPHTAPNSALALDVAVISDASLYSPIIPITATNATVSFFHRYELEPGYDGGVLEISTNGGAYMDILAAGGSFVAGGYNATVAAGFGNPLANRAAWSNTSAVPVNCTVNLPISAAGKNVQLRWRLGTDSSNDIPPFYGWNVDAVFITNGYACCQGSVPPLMIVDTRSTNNSIEFSFNTVPGRTYVTEFQNVLNTNLSWTPLQTNAGDGAKKSVTNSTLVTSNRFFRVRSQ